jgi:RNA 3'-terminal phosphate cyclase (ATP)
VADDVHIDGSMGEGGGQVLRSSLALAIATGRAVSLTNIRAGRKKPGLQPQHLASVRAAAAVCSAHVEGAAVGARAIRFSPNAVVGGTHRIDIGTAGATSLVAHTVIPALVATGTKAQLIITGGTHVPMSPPFEHLAFAYAPALEHVGARVSVRLEAHGFLPEGGGRIVVDVDPPAVGAPTRLEVLARGAIRAQRLIVVAGSRIPTHVADREVGVLRKGLARVDAVEHVNPPRAGNAVAFLVDGAHITDVFSAVGARGVPAELVAGDVVDEVRAFLAADVPVGEHLADQLLLPMALLQGGAFITLPPTLHTTTNAEVIKRFLDVDITFTPVGTSGEASRVRVDVVVRRT